MDREPKYNEITIERFKAMASGNLKIRRLGTRVHTPSGSEKVARIPESWMKYESNR